MTETNSRYCWIEGQGEAFGAPGLEPRWTSSAKDAVCTAYSASSKVWFTVSHGILNEVYCPTIDRPQIRDMQFLITDGETFFHEERRDLIHEFEYIDHDALAVRVRNRDRDGRYTIEREMISDPHYPIVLLKVRVEADEELLSRLRLYALLAPHLEVGGMGNSARVAEVAGKRLVIAWKDEMSLAFACDWGFSRASCGFVGASDGWQDLKDNFRMDWEFGSATNGNIAIMAEIPPEHTREFTIGIGFGEGHHMALAETMGSLAVPFERHLKRFIEQWHRVATPMRLAEHAQDGGRLLQVSHNVVLAHEDKTFAGAFIASASIPWGYAKSDEDLGGYHLVWTRDMVQTATALMACGRVETARRALVYLACTQKTDGGFAQNFWVDGRPYWSGEQLDEVAFPIILAWRLWKANALGEMEIFPFIERAAGFLVQHAPITHQERWEENAGYSPSTLAAVMSGLICAADMARAHDATELAVFLEEFADWIERHLEEWTITNEGVLLPEVKRHYMRIRPPEKGAANACEECGTETIHQNNRPPGAETEFEARGIIDAGFLELVRHGVRRADDPLVIDSLKVVDAVLKTDLPQGPGWHRYNFDGYGQRPDGGPFQGWGQGRVWPLFTGERAHYELAAGNDPAPLIATYERFATLGQMMPEQVWDEADRGVLEKGKPAGSAVPLVWAHAEYLKLLRSAVDGKVFDRIDSVYERYCEPDGRKKRRANLEVYSRRRPIQKITAGDTLRILDDAPFEVIWTTDHWKTTESTMGRSLGSAGYSVDLYTARNQQSGVLSWTFHWRAQNRWLGYNVEITIEPPTEA